MTEPTLLLNRSEVESLLTPIDLAPVLRQAFIAYSRSRNQRALRVRSELPGPGTATVLFPGLAPGAPVYTVKVHAKFPDETPAIRGVLCLHAAESGALLAVMDSTHLTAVRTGLCGALAAHVLARREADTVAVVGAGAQGLEQLRSLAALRSLRRASVYDIRPGRSEEYARAMTRALAVPVEPASSLTAALEDAGIVLTATWAREPFLPPEVLATGAHVTTLGSDEPGKAEVSAEAIREGLFVCDDRELAAEMGPVGSVGLGRDAIDAELGEVLAGAHPGRTAEDQLTIYAGVGLAFQDALAAWSVYRAARERRFANEFDFLA